MGKSSINGQFSMAMLNNQRVLANIHPNMSQSVIDRAVARPPPHPAACARDGAICRC